MELTFSLGKTGNDKQVLCPVRWRQVLGSHEKRPRRTQGRVRWWEEELTVLFTRNELGSYWTVVSRRVVFPNLTSLIACSKQTGGGKARSEAGGPIRRLQVQADGDRGRDETCLDSADI